MEQKPKTPQDHENELKIAYATEIYDFMESVPFKKIPKLPIIRYTEWLSGGALVQIHQIDKEYMVVVTNDNSVTRMTINQDYEMYAKLHTDFNIPGLAYEKHIMNIDDWTHLHDLIEQNPEFTANWSPEE